MLTIENREYFEPWFKEAFSDENYDLFRGRVETALKSKSISGQIALTDEELSCEDLKLLAMFVSFIEGHDVIPWEKHWGHHPLSFPPTAYYVWATDPELRIAYWARYDPAGEIPELDLVRMRWTLKQSDNYWVPARDPMQPLSKMHVWCFDTEIDLPVGLKAEEVPAYQEVEAKYGHPKMSDCTSHGGTVSERKARLRRQMVCNNITNAGAPV